MERHLADMVSELPEFAEEYGFRERIRLLVVGIVAGGAFILVFKLWLLPAFVAFAASAHCRSVFRMSGTYVLLYGLFVGLPILVCLILGGMRIPLGLKILRDGQYPPIGVRVSRRTRIRRGATARRIGYLNLLVFTPLLVLAVWGYFQVDALAQLKRPACAAMTPLEQTTASGQEEIHRLAAETRRSSRGTPWQCALRSVPKNEWKSSPDGEHSG
jgi:hypothetical protein